MLQIYADESSQTKHRFLVLGALVLTDKNELDGVTKKFELILLEKNLGHELYWGGINEKMYERYKAVIDLFFELNSLDLLHFHALDVDTSTFNNRKFNSGENEVGFNKLIFQLLLHKCGKRYGKKDSIEVFLDRRETTQNPSDMRDMLNRTLARDHNIKSEPFLLVDFIDSKDSCFIQVCDILIGAIAYRRNEHDKKVGANTGKVRFAKYIADRAAKTHPFKLTDILAKRFTYWQFKYKK